MGKTTQHNSSPVIDSRAFQPSLGVHIKGTVISNIPMPHKPFDSLEDFQNCFTNKVLFRNLRPVVTKLPTSTSFKTTSHHNLIK
uniref:Uncharacterized protein n=1 Tax=Cucumis melo TaxID=3656 RepID=A0A9I9ECX8_CUCME